MNSTPLFLSALTAGVALLSVLVWMLVRVRSNKIPSGTASNPTSPLALRPMARLLEESDFRFLASQPGFTPKIASTLRRRRIRVFRAYLDALAGEFNALHRELRIMALYAETDRSDFAATLVRYKLNFGFNLFLVRLRMAFFWLGIQPADTSVLVSTIESMRMEWTRLAPMPAASMA